MLAPLRFGLLTIFAAALAAGIGSPQPASLSDHGRIVFLSTRGFGEQQIFAMTADGSDQVRLTEDPAYMYNQPAWSPDGRQILFTRTPSLGGLLFDAPSDDTGAGIYVMNADGGGQTVLAAGASNVEPAWSPDGSQIAFMASREIYVMDADGSHQTNLTNHPASDERPAWSPDGSQIAFVRRDESDNYDIYITYSDGTGERRLTQARKDDPVISFGIDWSPDGSQIAFAAGLGGDIDIYLANVDGSGERKLTDNSVADLFPAWSPDGSQIAFGRGGEVDDIFLIAADGSGETNLTNSSASEVTYTWAPDGSQIAFGRIPEGGGNMDIYAINVDGSGERRLTTDPAGDFYPDWHQSTAAVPGPTNDSRGEEKEGEAEQEEDVPAITLPATGDRFRRDYSMNSYFLAAGLAGLGLLLLAACAGASRRSRYRGGR